MLLIPIYPHEMKLLMTFDSVHCFVWATVTLWLWSVGATSSERSSLVFWRWASVPLMPFRTTAFLAAPFIPPQCRFPSARQYFSVVGVFLGTEMVLARCPAQLSTKEESVESGWLWATVCQSDEFVHKQIQCSSQRWDADDSRWQLFPEVAKRGSAGFVALAWVWHPKHWIVFCLPL